MTGRFSNNSVIFCCTATSIMLLEGTTHLDSLQTNVALITELDKLMNSSTINPIMKPSRLERESN